MRYFPKTIRWQNCDEEVEYVGTFLRMAAGTDRAVYLFEDGEWVVDGFARWRE